MSRKELVISAKLALQSEEFVQGIKAAQDQLNKMQQSSASNQMQNQLNQRLQQLGYAKGLPGSPSHDKTMRDARKAEADEKRFLDDKIKLQERIIRNEERLTKLMEAQVRAGRDQSEVRRTQSAIDNLGARKQENLGQISAGAGPLRPSPQTQGQRLQSGDALSSILKGVSGVLATLATGAAVYDQYSGLQSQRSVSLGNATQNIVGNQLQGISSGNVVGTMAFLPERQKAMKMAMERSQATQQADVIKAATGIWGIASHVLGDDKIYNLMAGGITAQLAKNLQSETSSFATIPGIKNFGKKVGDISDTYMSTYQSKLMEEYGKNYQQLADAEIQKNPLKNLAAQRLQDNYGQDLQTQRMLGLGYQGFHGKGGFEENANMAGFNPQLAAAMAGQIQGAGGSTRGMAGSSVLGLQAQRGFDLTNAGSVLGRISGGAGGAQSSELVFKKLLEESVKAGLDKSEFREEQRKFADITSEILSKSGVTTAEDATKTLQGFSRFLGAEPTMREMQGAKSAYEEQQGFSAETGGRGGALQFAGLMKEGLGGIGAKGLAGLMEMPEQDLISTNPRIIAAAAKAGIEPQDLIEKLTKAKREKSQVEVGLDPKRMAALNKYMQSGNLDESTITKEQIMAMPEDIQSAYQEHIEAGSVRSAYQGMQKATAVSRGLRGGGAAGGAEGYGPSISGMIEGKLAGGTGRPEDEVVRSTGVAAQAMLENFRNFKTEITPASEALDSFTKKLIVMANALNMIPDKDKASAAKYIGEQLSQPMTPKSQPAPGKPH